MYEYSICGAVKKTGQVSFMKKGSKVTAMYVDLASVFQEEKFEVAAM